MNKEIIFLVEESAEGGYEAKALGHSIYTRLKDHFMELDQDKQTKCPDNGHHG